MAWRLSSLESVQPVSTPYFKESERAQRVQQVKCLYNVTMRRGAKKFLNLFYFRWESNLAAVWGQMSAGGGHSRLEETAMSVIGISIMTKSSFIDTERAIGEMWKQELLHSMAEAGREKQLAIERNEGVPAITVVVDGGWSKKLHKHSYNANSSVGIILGKETGSCYISVCATNIVPLVHLP